jgi:hypothetical protein
MKQTGELVGLVNIFRNARDLWRQYCLEVSCSSAINIWEDEHPEYIDKIRRWIKEDRIPDDNDLQTLCRVYEERVRPERCYRHLKT